jgi:hypothetical protein
MSAGFRRVNSSSRGASIIPTSTRLCEPAVVRPTPPPIWLRERKRPYFKAFIFLLNASLHAYAAESLALEPLRFIPDRRASILNEPCYCGRTTCPQLSKREYHSARFNFWSVLRRQIALGLANDTRMTLRRALLWLMCQPSRHTRREHGDCRYDAREIFHAQAGIATFTSNYTTAAAASAASLQCGASHRV